MKKSRLILFILLIIFISNLLINSNEISAKKRDEITYFNNISFKSFNFNSTFNKINNFNQEEQSGNKGKGFLAMGVIGSVLCGTGLAMTIAGIALTAYGYEERWKFSSDPDDYGWYQDYTIFFIGIGILVPGFLIFSAGIPLMIIGFFYYAKNKSVSLYMDQNNEYSEIGVKIKI